MEHGNSGAGMPSFAELPASESGVTPKYLRRIDWAASIGADGRPVVTDPRGCPSDAANWDSTAYSTETVLYYFMALEECVGKPTAYPD